MINDQHFTKSHQSKRISTQGKSSKRQRIAKNKHDRTYLHCFNPVCVVLYHSNDVRSRSVYINDLSCVTQRSPELWALRVIAHPVMP